MYEIVLDANGNQWTCEDVIVNELQVYRTILTRNM